MGKPMKLRLSDAKKCSGCSWGKILRIPDTFTKFQGQRSKAWGLVLKWRAGKHWSG